MVSSEVFTVENEEAPSVPIILYLIAFSKLFRDCFDVHVHHTLSTRFGLGSKAPKL